MTAGEWLTLVGIAISGVFAGGAVLWRRAGDLGNIYRKIGQEREKTSDEFKILRTEITSSFQHAYTHFGEAPAGVREKVNQLELYVEREFISKREYDKDQSQLMRLLDEMRQSLEKRFDKMEEKLDARSPNRH